jgi:hypothetical protein
MIDDAALSGVMRRSNILAKGSLIASSTEKCHIVSAEHVRIASTEIIWIETEGVSPLLKKFEVQIM